MSYLDRMQKVPGALAERLYTSIRRYRNTWSRYKRPEDLHQLIRTFPNITLTEGYFLDYIPMGGPKSSWIWPFAKPVMFEAREYLPEGLEGLARDQLMGMRGTPDGVQIAKQTLYKYLRYPSTQLGIFEYAIFVMELWATKSESKAREWLTLNLLFTRHSFDNLVLKSQAAKRIRRPEVYEPTVQIDPGGGGKVEFLAYDTTGWKRVLHMLLRIDPGGHVEVEPGKVLVDLGG
jgi:hypothetical protein